MKQQLKSLVLIVLSLTIPAAAVDAQGQPPEGFTAIFNGKDLTGWKGLAGKGGERAGCGAAVQQAQRTRRDCGV